MGEECEGRRDSWACTDAEETLCEFICLRIGDEEEDEGGVEGVFDFEEERGFLFCWHRCLFDIRGYLVTAAASAAAARCSCPLAGLVRFASCDTECMTATAPCAT